MKKKEKILMTALNLFNDKGSGNISTNHIAKELGISPGNLYYHFSNKEEIIRAIFDKMLCDYDEIYGENIVFDENDILRRLLYNDINLIIKYRFLYNEMSILFKHDLEIKDIFLKNQNKREVIFFNIFKFLQNRGYIKEDISDLCIKSTIKIIWHLENFRLFRYSLRGVEIIDDKDLDYKEVLLERLIPLYGFLTEKGHEYFESYKYI